VTEIKLPEELEEQAMLYALGLLAPEDRQAFMVRLQGESDLVRQAATAYQAATDALAAAVTPVTPPSTLRERVVHQVALKAAHEAEQFELTANTLALGSVPVRPPDSLRERLMSRIEGQADVRLVFEESMNVQGKTPVSTGLPQDAAPPSSWLRSCWTATSNFLRTLVIRSATSERVRYWKAKIALQQPTKGLTFIKASEGTWRELAPGVTAKVLSFDPASRRTTSLLRFAPGTSSAPHRHTAVEELYVLEGGCNIAGREMTVGDYHRAEIGTVHDDTSTDDGCLLLVISSPQNEMLH
jgi:anti-sigma factor ChrR (cupin superfamily)